MTNALILLPASTRDYAIRTDQPGSVQNTLPKFVPAMIVGIGVDTMHLPRLANLLSRQALRIGQSMTHLSLPASTQAAERFSRRILYEKEQDEWRQRFGNQFGKVSDIYDHGHLRWIAVR